MRKHLSLLLLLCTLICAVAPVSSVFAEGEENLVLGLDYTIETGEPVKYSYANYDASCDVDKGQLTDGKTGQWYRSFRAQSRIVTFDIGSVSAVSYVEAGFYNHASAAVYAPRYINVWLSENGTDYALVAEYETGFVISNPNAKRVEFTVSFDKIYEARYVKVEYTSDILCYCDEIRVMGSKTLSGSEAKITIAEPEEPRGYCLSLAGVSDIIKLYNGYYAAGQDIGDLTEDEFLPYVAYLDKDGNIVDTMFDSVALVPCHGDYPSGGRLVKTNGKEGAVMSDWELYFEHTFKEGKDLDALNKVVGRVYDELEIEGKYKVFLTMPYPTVISKPFGDINGDGKQDLCYTLEQRLNIVKWFADKCIAKFESQAYENLELAGFYWLREEVNYSDSDHEGELVIGANEYIHDKGYVTIFDPFYLSIGFDQWEDLGFDGAVMQPNLAFRSVRGYFSLEMLGEFAVSAYNNYTGVEIETDEPSYFRGDEYLEAGFNYESYLYYGYKTGYMNSLKTYYQGGGPGSYYLFCNADTKTPQGIYLRRLYDITYQFIKGTYKNEAPVISATDIELVAGDKRGMGNLSIEDEDSYWSDIVIEFVTEPQHGAADDAGGKRTLIYSPEEGYVGEDSFTIRAFDGFNYSNEITVNVTVGAADGSGDASSDVSGSDDDTDSDGEGFPVIAIVAIAIAAVAVIGAVAAFLLKKKK